MLRAVCGFFFSVNRETVVLIRKRRPPWQAGLLNGVGGKIEEHEAPLDAMRREFREETGLYVEDWDDFCLHHDENNGFEVTYFRAFGDDVTSCETRTDEDVGCYPVSALPSLSLVPNLAWIVPMALDRDLSSAETVWRDPDRRHLVEEVRSLYTLRCGRCDKTFKDQGTRHGRLCAFDVESEGYEAECPHCHAELEVEFPDEPLK